MEPNVPVVTNIFLTTTYSQKEIKRLFNENYYQQSSKCQFYYTLAPDFFNNPWRKNVNVLK